MKTPATQTASAVATALRGRCALSPGIAEEDRAKVLNRGVRTDGNVPGHGLGLAIVHDTVDLYGGVLMVDASPLGGARFSLRLPGKITLPRASDRAEEPPR